MSVNFNTKVVVRVMGEEEFNPCNPLRYVNCYKCQMWQTMRCLHYGWGTITKSSENYLDKLVFGK